MFANNRAAKFKGMGGSLGILIYQHYAADL